MNEREDRKPGAEIPEARTKKQYASPELIIHGTVEKFTEEQKGSGDMDGGSIANPTRRSN